MTTREPVFDRGRVRVDRESAEHLFDVLLREEERLIVLRHGLKFDHQPFDEEQRLLKLTRRMKDEVERILDNWPNG